MDTEIKSLLEFWFGPLDSRGLCLDGRNSLWFQSSEKTDEHCRQAYASLLTGARAGQLDHWAVTEDGLVALVVLMDQFSRNIHRGTPEAFAADPAALALAQAAIAAGRDRGLPPIHRAFLYLPLEHCEDPAVQEQCVMLFRQLAESTPDDQLESFTRFAIAHRDVIAQFGRFPHRNRILGRESTKEEIEYMKTHRGF